MGALVAIGGLLAVPEHVWSAAPPVCVIRNLFDRECLGCGMTRALSAFAHGDFGRGIALNSGVLVAAPALVLAAIQGIRFSR